MKGDTRNVRGKFLFTVCLMLLAVGCSLAGFAYDLAPRLAVRYADDYLQLSKRQQARALELFRERHALHARDELPRYYAFLNDVRAMAEDGLTRTEVDEALDRARGLYQLAVQRTLPAIGEILAGLEPAQIDLLAKRLADELEEDRERLQEDMLEEERLRRREETLEDITQWVGVLNDAQRSQIVDALEAMQPTRPLWLEWRGANSERFIAFMRDKPSPVEIENFLAAYWIDRKDMPEELVARLEENVNRYRDMIVALDGTLTVEQRAHARERLAEFAELVADVMPDDIRRAVLEGGKRELQQAR